MNNTSTASGFVLNLDELKKLADQFKPPEKVPVLVSPAFAKEIPDLLARISETPGMRYEVSSLVKEFAAVKLPEFDPFKISFHEFPIPDAEPSFRFRTQMTLPTWIYNPYPYRLTAEGGPAPTIRDHIAARRRARRRRKLRRLSKALGEMSLGVRGAFCLARMIRRMLPEVYEEAISLARELRKIEIQGDLQNTEVNP